MGWAWVRNLFREPTEAEYVAQLRGQGIEIPERRDCGHRGDAFALDPRTGRTACLPCVRGADPARAKG
jgi:hypothetical protein